MIKIGLDWCLKNKPRKGEYTTEIHRIIKRTAELNELDFDKHPDAKKEYDDLLKKLSELQMCPEETVGMKRLKELSEAEKKKAFEEFAVPRIEDAKKGEGHEGFNKHWRDMTFERWIKESAETFLEWDMPKIMKNMPRVFGAFQAMAGWMSFRGKCVGYCELIPSELQNEAYEDKDPEQMIDYAQNLERYSKKWETANKSLLSQIENFKEKLQQWSKDNHWTVTIRMDEKQKKSHQKKMKEKYGNEFIGFKGVLKKSKYYDYKILIDAINWLRFWGERGHGMHAWY